MVGLPSFSNYPTLSVVCVISSCRGINGNSHALRGDNVKVYDFLRRLKLEILRITGDYIPSTRYLVTCFELRSLSSSSISKLGLGRILENRPTALFIYYKKANERRRFYRMASSSERIGKKISFESCSTMRLTK
jgi:hypothetical protein